jgi:hypothetical protein
MSPTRSETGLSGLASRYLLLGHPDIPRAVHDALESGRTADAARILAGTFGLSMRDACELVK